MTVKGCLSIPDIPPLKHSDPAVINPNGKENAKATKKRGIKENVPAKRKMLLPKGRILLGTNTSEEDREPSVDD